LILVTVGTQLTFDRLIKAVEAWAIENDYTDIVFQTGTNAYKPKVGNTYDFINASQMDKYFSAAELVIGHAGMGTILTCLTNSKPLVIMPRLFKYDEHRNDHQVGTFDKVKKIVGIISAKEESELGACISAALELDVSTISIGDFAEHKLIKYIQSKVFL
jgi:UDP-N-acetylglucosamine transferase subunit ALG13